MKNQMPLERLALRVSEFADCLGISRSKAYELIGSGGVEVVRVGKSIRVPVDCARKFLDAQRVSSEKLAGR